jgi:hypothetical protein
MNPIVDPCSIHAVFDRENRYGESVATTTLILARISTLPGVRRFTRREVPWGRPVVGSAIGIWVRRRRWRVIAAVRVLVTTPGRAILVHGASGRRPVAGTVIVVFTARASVAISVSFAAGTIPARRRGSAAIVVFRGWRIRATPARGARSAALSSGRHFRLSIGNALHATSFEFATVQLLNGGAKISSSLELNETSAIGITASFRVDHVKARLTRKVFEVLFPEST